MKGIMFTCPEREVASGNQVLVNARERGAYRRVVKEGLVVGLVLYVAHRGLGNEHRVGMVPAHHPHVALLDGLCAS